MIAAAEQTQNSRKIQAAHDCAVRLASEYYEDGLDVWPDPEEAARFEVTCWYWMQREHLH